MSVFESRKQELMDIIDFYYFIEDYGHVFGGRNEELDAGFNNINKGIEEIYKLVNEHYGR